MEKPSPYAISPRYLPDIRRTTESDTRYYDRLTLLGIPSVRDQEESDTPRWRGDHSFSSDAATYSLTNFIEPEVAVEHPDWSKTQVRDVALARFEKRLQQDLSYEQKESAHEESVVTWQPIQTEKGWELATAYGDKMVTLSELWEHTREYAAFVGNPTAYNAKEHEAQLLMQDKLMNGQASGFVSILSHPDSVRYVQMWQKGGDGNIVSTQIDLYKTTGRDFSCEEGVRLIEHLALFHGEANDVTRDADVYAHFFTGEKHIAERDVRLISTALVMDAPIPKGSADVGSVVLRDTTDSMVMLGMYLRDHIDRSIERMRERFGQEVNKGAADIARPGKEQAKKKRILIPPGARRESAVFPQKEPHVPKKGEGMKSIVADWWITAHLLRYTEHVPVAAVAMIFWITLPKHGVEKAPRRTRRDWQERRSKMRAPFIELFRFMPRKQESKKRLLRQRKRVTSSGHERHFVRPPAETVKKDKRKEAVPVRVLVRAVSKLRELSAFFQKAEHTKRDSSVAVARLTFAFLFLWFIRTPSRAVSLKEYGLGDDTKLKEQPLANREIIPTHQWVLLSIIWYLSALREQGKPGAPKKKKKATKSGNAIVLDQPVSLPASGIIFAYSS